MKRILIDGRFVGVGDSMTRYCLELVRGILAIDKENDYTLLLRPLGEEKLETYPDIVNAPNLKVDILDIPHYSLAEQTKLLKYLKKEKYDLVHFIQFNHPIFYKGNYVVTIHDLTLIGHLHYKNILKQFAYKIVMRSAVRDSKKVITISKTSEDDIIDFFGDYRKKIEIIYHGVDYKYFNANFKSETSRIANFKEKYDIKGDYILYTGMWKKHKNLIRLFKAFEQFIIKLSSINDQLPINYQLKNDQLNDNWKMENGKCCPQLVLTGKIDQNEPEVISEMERINSSMLVASSQQSAEKNNTANCQPQTANIITTGFIDEEELPIAYAAAIAYVIPSLSEGFGWPPLEAMACGTPVIASNISCIPEILGKAPLYFDPYDIDDIAKAIAKIVSDPDLRSNLSKKGLEQVKKYNWSNTAQQTLDLYKSALK